MNQGFGGFLLLTGDGWGCGCGCRAGDSARFRCVLLGLPVMMLIKILNSFKSKSTPGLCRTSLWCVAGIFTVTNEFFVSQRGFI